MAVAIQPGALVGGGQVDTSRPNDGGVHQLAGALDVTARSAAEIGAIAQAHEFNNIQSLLKDATIGPDEAKEIAGNAFFPVNRFAAQNRAGEAKVAAARNQIEDDLVQSTDSIDARQRLRAHQQKLMEDETDPGVQAGIREAIAQMAGPMINNASKNRLELRNMQRRKDESFILRRTLIDDPAAFTDQLKAILGDQKLDATQEPDIHETASQTLLNTLIENPASLPIVKQAAQEALKSNAVDNATDRARYTGVLKAVQVLENKAASEHSDSETRKRLKGAYGGLILDELAVHPGQMPSEKNMAAYIANSDDPLTAKSKILSMVAASKGSPIGIIGSDAHKNGRKTLDTLFAGDMLGTISPENRAKKAAAAELYDSITGAIDSDVLKRPEEANLQAQQAAKVAFDRAEAFSAAAENSASAREARKKELDQETLDAVQRNDGAALRKINKELNDLNQASMLDARRSLVQGVIDYAETTGINIDRDLRP